MTDRYKFRAWDKENRVIREIQRLVWDKDNLIAHCPPRGHEFSEWFTVVLNGWEYHLMQSTGLTDSNGKEIYEGDIVRSREGNDYTAVYQNGIYMAYNPEDLRRDYKEPVTQFNVIWREGCEVIGNRYQNPELKEV